MYICIGSGDSERYDRLLRYLARLDFLVHFNLVKAGASVTGYSETVRLWCIRAEIGGLSVTGLQWKRYHPVNYLFVVINQGINAVICTMKRQRQNDFFVGQVADRLAKARRRLNLTQEVVRFDTGLNVGRIEAGCSDITLSTLAVLCDYYDISPGELFQDIVTHSS